MSVDLQDSLLFVGSNGQGDSTGAVYIYNLVTKNYEATLVASDSVAYDMFGSSVAIDQDELVVGAPGKNTNQGAVYVFEKSVNGWTSANEVAVLQVSAGMMNDRFGTTVDISDGVVLGGAYGVGNNVGSAYIFDKPTTGWTSTSEDAVLTHSGAQDDDWFGIAIAIQQDQIICGAPFTDSLGLDAGGLYLYDQPASGWSTTTESYRIYQNRIGNMGDRYGTSVVVEDQITVVGAPNENQKTGAVYVLEFNGVDWNTIARLVASDSTENSEFGQSVDIQDSMIVVGAPSDQGVGAVYVFKRQGAEWVSTTEEAKLTASDAAASDRLGI